MSKIINRVTYKGNEIKINQPKNRDIAQSIINGDITEFIDSDGFYTYLGSHAFDGCSNLSIVNMPACKSMGKSAITGTLNEVLLPNCEYVDLAGCDISRVDIPKCKYVAAQGLRFNTTMSVLNLPYCEYIDVDGGNRRVSEFIAPKCSYLGTSAFYQCSLVKAIFPQCLSVGSNAFRGCTKLEEIDITKCSYLGTSAFSGCSRLVSINLPNVTSIGSDTFRSCSRLETINGYNSFNMGERKILENAFKNTSKNLIIYKTIQNSQFIYATCSYTPALKYDNIISYYNNILNQNHKSVKILRK